MMDLKISQFTVPSAVNSDAFLPIIQLSGVTETNYKITIDQLATAMSTRLAVPVYVKTWNADINIPVLSSSVGTTNTIYIVNEPGSTSLNGIASWAVGDMAYFAGGVWQKIPAEALPTLTGASNPTTATVGALGQLYINTSSTDVFCCVAITGGPTYTWINLIQPLNAQFPLTYNGVSGDLGLNYEPTNLTVLFDTLDTIQPIHLTATPTFSNVNFANLAGSGNLIPVTDVAGKLTADLLFNYDVLNQKFGVGVLFANVNSNFHQVGTRAIGRSTISTSTPTSAIPNELICVTATSPQVTVTLSTSSKVDGRLYTIKDQAGTANTTPIIISPESGTIDGQASLQITANYGAMKVYSDGTNWFTR